MVFNGTVDAPPLTDLERELLELCSNAPNMGETTTSLHEEMLEEDHERAMIDEILRGLVTRGLMTTSRGTFGGVMRPRDGRVEHRIYDDDWWVVTDAGRAAIGLPLRGSG